MLFIQLPACCLVQELRAQRKVSCEFWGLAARRQHREAVHGMGGPAAEQLPRPGHDPLPNPTGGQLLPSRTANLVSIPVCTAAASPPFIDVWKTT